MDCWTPQMGDAINLPTAEMPWRALMRTMRNLRLLFVFACVFGLSARAAEISDLDALHGRVVYLDFWASWCAPCRHSFPWMEGMKKQYEAKGVKPWQRELLSRQDTGLKAILFQFGFSY